MKFKVLALALLAACGGANSVEFVKGLDGAAGVAGPKGDKGDAGADGAAGVGCSVQSVLPSLAAPNGGSLITCGVSSTLVLNGTNGTNGINGTNGVDGQDGADGIDGQDGADGQDGLDAPPTAYSIVEVIDPCGDAPAVFDEVLLRLANGTLVASLSENNNGKNTRLSILTQGSYTTTDGTSCTFNVSWLNAVTW